MCIMSIVPSVVADCAYCSLCARELHYNVVIISRSGLSKAHFGVVVFCLLDLMPFKYVYVILGVNVVMKTVQAVAGY